jgi:RNA polymerase sigma-70 factor (ECF subfamily)
MTNAHHTPSCLPKRDSEQRDPAEPNCSFLVVQQESHGTEEQTKAAGKAELNLPQPSAETAGSQGKSEPMSEPSGDNNPPAPLKPATVLRDHTSRVYNLAWRLLGSESDAEDVTQDVLLQAIRNLSTFGDEASLRAWMHQRTVSTALALRDKLAARKPQPETAPKDQAPTAGPRGTPMRSWSVPHQQNLSKELHELIEKVMRSLSPADHDVYVLGEIEGVPRAEIAALLSMSLPTVKSCLHRVRLLMRDALTSHFEDQGT